MKKSMFNRVLSMVLVVVLCLGLVAPVGALTDWGTEEPKFTMQKVDNSAVTAPLGNQVQEVESLYDDEDIVRVSIVLEKKSTLEMAVSKGISNKELSVNTKALQYRSDLRVEQETMVQKISSQVLGGKALDVVLNLTLAANIISANVEYGKLEAIRALPGVKEVVLEAQFMPADAEKSEAVTNMVSSGALTGAGVAWESGYTGAGMRIAIVDTGLDYKHEAFDAAAFEYALEETAAAAGKTVADYDLLDLAEIAQKLPQLNASRLVPDVTAEQLYYSTKVGFGLNYKDFNTDISHLGDTQGEHGSHVAGIAAANRYVDTNKDGVFEKALEATLVTGNAPDAQLMIFKTFGNLGGPYETDLVVSIEDALILGADVINMSLGTPSPGFVVSEIYQDTLNRLEQTDTVLVVSSGNNGYWIQNQPDFYYNYLAGGGYLHAEDVNFATGGAPGTYANTFTVASVDNLAYPLDVFVVDGWQYIFTESEFSNVPIKTLDTSEDFTGTEYDFVFIDGPGTLENYEGIDIAGKVVFCQRGEISFSEKGNNAASLGAKAIVVYNNDEGSINMDLSDYTYTTPCIAITMADAERIKGAAEAKDGYCAGKISFFGKPRMQQYRTAPVMSDFSSWGVPGDLSIKPEISAPGGGIYSVMGAYTNGTTIWGGDNNKYENMSGTSMASPQIAGMTALVLQYIQENELSVPGMTDRALAQALLMSTAMPLKDANGNYYPVMQQGSGLGDVGRATSVNSFVTVIGMADGKVKAELGEDAERTGIYEFSFVINNMTDAVQVYDLSADLFTQQIIQGIENLNFGPGLYTSNQTEAMEATTVFAGENVAENVATVPAGGKTTVKVTMTLSDAQKTKLNENFKNGAYVQAFVYAEPQDEAVTAHSIPVLAFYGKWSDARMLDHGEYGQDMMSYPQPYLAWAAINGYTMNYADGTSGYLGGNPVVADSVFMPERNAISSGVRISGALISPIRSVGASRVQIKVGDEVLREFATGSMLPTYYEPSYGAFSYQVSSAPFIWRPEDLAEGTKVTFSLDMALEYYMDQEGNVDWEKALGAGSSLTTTAIIDNTEPQILDFKLDLENMTITVKASDENYLAGVVLYNSGGSKAMATVGSKTEIAPGEEAEYTLDISKAYGKRFLLQAIDYAGNRATYVITQQIGEPQPIPEMLAYKHSLGKWDGDGVGFWDTFNRHSSNGDYKEYAATKQIWLAAAIVDGLVMASNEFGEFYAMPLDDMSYERLVSDLGTVVYDMAYSEADGLIYAVDQTAKLLAIDPMTGEVEQIAQLGFKASSLAVDKNGVFYSHQMETGNVWSFTLEGLEQAAVSYDFNADGILDDQDVQTLLDYAVGNLKNIPNLYFADLNKDGKVTAADADLLLSKIESGELLDEVYTLLTEVVALNSDTKTPLNFKIQQSLEIDPNTGLLCWASVGQTDSGSRWYYFFEIDTVTGEYTQYENKWRQLTAMIIPEKDTGHWSDPTEEVSEVLLPGEVTVVWQSQLQLTARVMPWMVIDSTVTWATMDENIATVDEDGVVYGVNPGTTIVTATSNLDPTKSASCVVKVEALDITLHGTLTDSYGNNVLFDWNMTEKDWTPTMELDFAPYKSITDNKNNLWIMENDGAEVWPMHKLDMTTGEEVDYTEPDDGIAFYDISYSPMFSTDMDRTHAIYLYYLTPATDITNPTQLSFELGGYSGTLSGGDEFIGLATAGTTMFFDPMDEKEVEAEILYMLDDAGWMWEIYLYAIEGGNYRCYYRFIPSNLLQAGYVKGEMNIPVLGYLLPDPQGTMVLGEDGNLYLAAYDGNATILYRFVYDEINDEYNVDMVGSLGNEVVPVSLYSVTSNTNNTQTNHVVRHPEKLMAMDAKPVSTEKMVADKLAAEALETQTVVKPYDETLVVELTAKDQAGVEVDSTNGMFTVTYDPTLLELVSAESDNEFFASNNAAEGKVVLGYVDREILEAGEVAATLTFKRLVASEGNVQVSYDEVGLVEDLPFDPAGYPVEFKSGSATLNGKIGLNFYLSIPEKILTAEDAKMVFTVDGVVTEVPASQAKASIQNGMARYRFTIELAAAQMADVVTAQIFVGEHAVSEAKEYSVMQYASSRIMLSTDASEIALMKAMLNYGAYAQLSFGHNVENLANANLAEADKVLPGVTAQDLEAYASVITGEAEGIVAKSGTLLLQSGTKARVYFKLTGDKKITDYTFTVDGKQVTPIEKNGQYYIETEEIAAAELDQMHVFTCDGLTITHGPLSFVRSMLDSAEVDVVNMVESLYEYHLAAKAFFGK